ncbi:MAG: hypothetical protein ACREDR_48135, partial [Blastocatellia bacterium]
MRNKDQMTREELKDEIAECLDGCKDLSSKIDWEDTYFDEGSIPSELSNERNLRVDIRVKDNAWMPAIREIVRERCRQIEAEEETVRIEAVFRTEWGLDEDGLECVGRIPQRGGMPLCTGVRYLASLRSGNARISAIADVHIPEDAGEPPIEQVRSFLKMRLSAPGGGRWDP